MTFPPGRESPGRVLVRALLVAIGVVALLPGAAVVAGALAPDLPTIGRFTAFVNTSLPWAWASALVALACGALAAGLGARVAAALVLVPALAVTLGAGLVSLNVLAFASDLGAPLSILRTLAPDPVVRGPDERIVLATAGGTDLEAEIWRVTESSARPVIRGTVVYVHGGGFVGGELRSRPATFAHLADAGYLVIDVEYRLAPPPRWQDAPADVLCALAWLAREAQRFGVEPEKTVVMGESAGGNLALLAAYGAGSPATPPSCPGDAVPPAGVIAIAPAVDLAGIWSDRTLMFGGAPFPEAYIDGPPSEHPDRYAAASPSGLVRPGLPPTLLVIGSNDHLVRPERSTTIVGPLRAAGVDVRLVVVPYADHGFDGPPNGLGAQVLEALVPRFLAEVLG